MYVFLPDRGSDLGEFLTSLTAENWETWISKFEEGHGDIVLPRFRLEYGANLKNALTALGMGIAFSNGADFSGMAPGDLFIDSVLHKAVVEVNELGTEAAASTAVGIAGSASAFEFDFVADRPFFFAIREDRTEKQLFMGVVYNPEALGT
jgi:serpin B